MDAEKAQDAGGIDTFEGSLVERLRSEGRLTFGNLLRELRENAKLTQRGLIAASASRYPNHRISGLVVTALSHWEDDRRVPLPPQLLAVIAALREYAPHKERFDDYTLALLSLAREADHRYAGLVSMWETGNLTAQDRLRSFGVWAATFPLRPPRGRVWEQSEEADDDVEGGLPSREDLVDGLGVPVRRG